MTLQKLLLKKNLQTSKNILLGKHFKPSKALILIRLKRGAANSIQFQLVVNGPNKKQVNGFYCSKILIGPQLRVDRALLDKNKNEILAVDWLG